MPLRGPSLPTPKVHLAEEKKWITRGCGLRFQIDEEAVSQWHHFTSSDSIVVSMFLEEGDSVFWETILLYFLLATMRHVGLAKTLVSDAFDLKDITLVLWQLHTEVVKRPGRQVPPLQCQGQEIWYKSNLRQSFKGHRHLRKGQSAEGIGERKGTQEKNWNWESTDHVEVSNGYGRG